MSWKRIRGHDALVQAFQRVIRRGRLAHAYLFVGPRGVGKKAFAVELAKTLLCERAGAGLDACDTCDACLQVEAGTHPDCFQVARPKDKNEFPIELMRGLLESFSLTSARGRGKVAILDDVDDLNEESANCFLKTLEEPPPHSVLILVGASIDRQLPTIVSRCQVVNFGRLADDDLAALLRARGIEDEAMITRLLHVSQGSPGVAQDLNDPELWDFRREFLAGLSSLPVDSPRLSKQWVEFVKDAGKESGLQRRRASSCVGLLLSFLQDALHQRLGLPASISDAEESKALNVLTERLDAERLLGLVERCLDGQYQINRFVQLDLILEALTDALGQKIGVKT